VTTPCDEQTIPPRLRRPLGAAWISLGLHAAVIALVQVAPPAVPNMEVSVIEARLVPAHVAPPAEDTAPAAPEAAPPDDTPEVKPLLAPSETAEALPVAKPVVKPDSPPVAPPEPVAAPPQPAVAAPAEPKPAPAVAASPPPPTPALSITSSVDLAYHSARDVDVHPSALHEIVPDYPAAADRQRVSGKVVLQLKIEADGRVTDVEVVSASPPGLFEDSAKQAFDGVRFSPAQKNGQPVRALVLIEVLYDWKGRRR
jgi:protein TonB